MLEIEERISMGGCKLNCIKFADDIIILTNHTKTLQIIIEILEEGVKKYLMKINLKETKIMRIKTMNGTLQ